VYSGKGLDFDGVNDQVQGSTGTSLPNSNYTICSWFYMDTLKTHGIVTWGDDTTGERRGMLVWNGSPPGYYCLRSSTYGSNPYGTTQLQAGVWYFGAVTVDSSGNANIYLNGELDGTGTNTLNAFSNTDYIIGNTRSNEWMDGKISSPKVFDVVLTAAQIKELYENPEQSVPTGVSPVNLKLHLAMTEGAGSYLYNANVNAIGTELISNAGFDETCQKWGTTDDSTVAIIGGQAIWTNAPLSGSFVEQPLDLEIGKFYRVKFDYTSTAFNIFVNIGDSQQAVPVGDGTFIYDMYYGSGSSSIKFKHGYTSNSSATVDNVSVKEVVPNFFRGTISGATWVSGLPEPLPQTALIDWNKGSNFISDSKNMSTSYGATYRGLSLLSDTEVSPIGTPGAFLFQENNTDGNPALLFDTGTTDNVNYTLRCWLKADRNYSMAFSTNGGTNIANISLTTEWQEFEVTQSTSNSLFVHIGGFGTITQGSGLKLWVWHPQLSKGDGEDLYIETDGTPQHPSKVLVPSGALSGKDVFGTPISNPRSAGAFNFDGISYVQGLNTGYLPTGNEARSLELWVYRKYKSTTQSLLEIGSGASNNQRFGILVPTAGTLYLVGQGNDNNFTGFSIPENEWTHIVATHDGTTLKVYRNGVLNASVSETYATIDVGYRIGLENRTTSTTSLSGSTEYSISQVSNPRIYDFALTAEQVADNYNQKSSTVGAAKTESELQAYINRTVAAGATVEDHANLLNTLTELDSKSGCL